MSVVYPAIPKPTTHHSILYTSMANIMDRPLPPLPLMQSPPYLQKERSPKRRHTRNVSSLDLPQPFASIQASITPLSSPPPITSTTIPPLSLQPRKEKLRKGRPEEYKKSLVPPQPFANVRASSMPGTPVIPIARITVPPKSSISPVSSRRSLSNSASDTEMTGTTRLSKRSTWFSSSRSKSRSRNFSQDMDKLQGPAWTSQDGIRVPYPLRALTDGQKIPELWSETGDCLVYLFPRSSNRAASFRIPSHLLSSSRPLLELMQSKPGQNGHTRLGSHASDFASPTSTVNPMYGARPLLTPPVTPRQQAVDAGTFYDGDILATDQSPEPESQPQVSHLYFPTHIKSDVRDLSPEEIQRLVDVRNLFAFLSLQPFVATPKCCRKVEVLSAIASLLNSLVFTNEDSSTLGDACLVAFDHYIQEFRLLDVRASALEVVEALILAEAMKSKTLYDEAFVHAVGQYEDIKQLNLYIGISQETRERLGKSHIQLENKKRNLAARLTHFQFHSLFAGIAISKTADESKYIRFASWQNNFNSIRKFALRYYKDLHGSWPPRPNKKNKLLVGGWNRLVLKLLYTDISHIYDLLVDRMAPTARNQSEGDLQRKMTPENAALRKLLKEYDESSPPVQPPTPFDVPLIPMIETISPGVSRTDTRERNMERSRRLKQNETLLLLTKSHNLDADAGTSFLKKFKEFEYDQARTKSANELMDMRYGHWIFIYAVIQALPQLVIDAHGITHSDGVEHFLSEPAIGCAPWVKDVNLVNRTWYGTSSDKFVYLPSDVVDHGFEAAYRRSHCWIVGEQWMEVLDSTHRRAGQPSMTAEQNLMSPLEPPPKFGGGQLRISPSSPARSSRSQSLDLGTGNAPTSPVPSHSAAYQRNRVSQQTLGHRRNASISGGLEKLRIVGDEDLYEHSILSAPAHSGSSQSSGWSSTPSSPSTYSGGRRRQGSIASYGQWSNSMTTLGTCGTSGGGRPTSSGGVRGGGGDGNGNGALTSFDQILAKIDVERNKRAVKTA